MMKKKKKLIGILSVFILFCGIITTAHASNLAYNTIYLWGNDDGLLSTGNDRGNYVTANQNANLIDGIAFTGGLRASLFTATLYRIEVWYKPNTAMSTTSNTDGRMSCPASNGQQFYTSMIGQTSGWNSQESLVYIQ